MSAALTDSFKSLNISHMAPPLFLVAILAMMTLPLPAILLDVFFTFNIALSLLVLLVGVQTLRPLEFAVFPTVLLVATLLRLALNIASTRIVLMEGHKGGDAAGKVIEAFGEVLIGGNYAVGLVVFLILIIINFVVVTKGAGRISEVTARFTLDAMPGKQMAIDADLNAGLIDQVEAKARRADIADEADFYGAMDGASKFVRGDAVAGILILVINLIGGLAIGIGQHDLAFANAMQKYALLTIGDGLVAQVPSLLLSTSAAIMVTRVNSAQDMAGQVRMQMFNNPQSMLLSAGILAVLGVIPGMPHLPFLLLAAGCVGLAVLIQKKPMEEALAVQDPRASISAGGQSPLKTTEVAGEAISGELAPKGEELGWDDVPPLDIVGLEVGYRLISLVDQAVEGDLLNRIRGVRRKLSQELGFLMPTVHIRDNLELLPNQYRILLKGVMVAEAEIHVDRHLAINPGQVFGEVQGIAGKDPAFGLDAIWIEPEQKDSAHNLGYTVVDPSTVIATHINHILQIHAEELLGFEELQKLLDQLSKKNAKLVENVVPQPISLSTLLSVLQSLLQEQVPIRDLRTVLEALSQAHAGHHQNGPQNGQALNLDGMLSAVRIALSRMIIHGLVGAEDDIKVMTLQPELEQMLTQSVQQSRQNGGRESDASIEPNLAKNLQQSVSELVHRQEMQGAPSILLVTSSIRHLLARFLRYGLPSLSVLSYNEIPGGKKITVVAQIGQNDPGH